MVLDVNTGNPISGVTAIYLQQAASGARIVATDRSAGASSALRLVGSLSWPTGPAIDVVGVLEPLPEIGLVPLGPVPPTEGEIVDALAALDRDAEPLRRPGITVRAHCFVGSPAQRIGEAAVSLDADLIVVGSRGRGGGGEEIPCSVATSPPTHTPCPTRRARRPSVRAALPTCSDPAR